MLPWLAMHRLNTWSKERGETKQQELIGMSSGRKAATTALMATFEFENDGE